MTDRFLREREVRSMTGLSRTTRWRLERVAKFPHRRQISPGAVGWLESEVLVWMNQGSECVGVVPRRRRLAA